MKGLCVLCFQCFPCSTQLAVLLLLLLLLLLHLFLYCCCGICCRERIPSSKNVSTRHTVLRSRSRCSGGSSGGSRGGSNRRPPAPRAVAPRTPLRLRRIVSHRATTCICMLPPPKHTTAEVPASAEAAEAVDATHCNCKYRDSTLASPIGGPGANECAKRDEQCV